MLAAPLRRGGLFMQAAFVRVRLHCRSAVIVHAGMHILCAGCPVCRWSTARVQCGVCKSAEASWVWYSTGCVARQKRKHPDGCFLFSYRICLLLEVLSAQIVDLCHPLYGHYRCLHRQILHRGLKTHLFSFGALCVALFYVVNDEYDST